MLFLCLAGAAVTFLPVRGDVPAGVTTLIGAIQNAYQAHDVEQVRACYDFNGDPPDAVDQSLGHWKKMWNDDEKNHRTLQKVEFKTLAQLQAAKDTASTYADFGQPHDFDGSIHAFDRPVFGFICVTSSDSSRANLTVFRCPIGTMADGSFRIIVMKPVH